MDSSAVALDRQSRHTRSRGSRRLPAVSAGELVPNDAVEHDPEERSLIPGEGRRPDIELRVQRDERGLLRRYELVVISDVRQQLLGEQLHCCE